MNPLYSIMESPHRWLIVAGIAFLAATIGAMMMLAFGWPHWLDRLWLIAGLVATGIALVLAFLDWKSNVESELERLERASKGR